MTIYEEIKNLKLSARKEQNILKLSSLIFIQGEIERQYKTPDDSKVIPLLRGMQTKLKDDPANAYDVQVIEEILNSFAPKLMTRNEIWQEIESADCKTIGEAMKYMRDKFPNKYLPSDVAELFKKN